MQRISIICDRFLHKDDPFTVSRGFANVEEDFCDYRELL